jgi:hypothetical protein
MTSHTARKKISVTGVINGFLPDYKINYVLEP